MNALNETLPFGLTADSLLIMLLSAMAFTTIIGIWFGLIERHPMELRTQRVAQRRNELKAGFFKSTNQSSRRAESLSLMKRVVKTLKLAQNQQVDKIHDRLAQAGFRSRDAVIVFFFFKVITPIGFGIASFVALYLFRLGDFTPAISMMIISAVCAFGLLAPNLYISNTITKRQLTLAKSLPDGLDLLVICAESGLSLDAGLERVAREIGHASPELAEELQLTSVELGFLPERRQALLNLNRRTNLSAIRGVVNTLVQTEKYGTPLSQSLRVLANEFRDQRLLKAEEKAARLPATLTVPMIVFILPVLFIVLIGPAIISVMDNLS